MTAYAYLLSQVPVIIAHLRDTMVPLQGTDYDRVRVDGSREKQLPFRIEPMTDADTLWAALTAYGNEVARHIHPSPYALLTRLRASTQWHDAGDAAHRITAWLIEHENRTAGLEPSGARELAADTLFDEISRLLNRYRITPRRLRTFTRECVLCGRATVYAEWRISRDGRVEQTEQCTYCKQRYEAHTLPTRAHIVTLPEWRA